MLLLKNDSDMITKSQKVSYDNQSYFNIIGFFADGKNSTTI